MPKEISGGIRVLRITEPGQVDTWSDAFAEAYVEIFAGEPYLERFSLEEGAAVLRQLSAVPDNVTLLATRDGEVEGFGIAVPLRSKPEVARELVGLVDLAHAHYLAELGVRVRARGQGLGSMLIRERMRLIDHARYSDVLLRVSTEKNRSYDMYRSMGFQDMGVYMEVANRRLDGAIAKDRRLFLHRVLSQVKL